MKTILIVDDVAANRELLGTVLTQRGHRVLEAGNGSEALVIAAAECPDLVITDVLMPGMNGHELVQRLRLDPSTIGIPIIFYTAPYGVREARLLADSGGVWGVLTKPVVPADVHEVVDRVLAGEREAPSAPSGVLGDHAHQLLLLSDRLSADLEEANARLRALINIGLELASERDLGRLLERVCGAVHDLFGASSVTVAILGLESRAVERVEHCGWQPGHEVQVGDALTGTLRMVVEERRTLRGGDPAGPTPHQNLPPLSGEKTYLVTPIASPASVYGWIRLIDRDGTPFTDDDEQLVASLSAQLGRIYENRYFYAMEQKRATELSGQILDRQKAEAALSEERDRAQRYLDTAEVILLALDPEGRITLVNRYACAVFGWKSEQLLGRDFIETCVPAANRAETRAKLARVLAGPDSSVVENAIVTRTGDVRMIEWRNTLIRDAGGRVVSTLSSGTDLTDRNAAVAALQLSEERTRFAMEAANVGIWDMDYATGMLRWSETSEVQYGIAPGTFDGTFETFVERIHPDDRESVLEIIGKATESGNDFTVLHRSIWPDGTVHWLNGHGRIQLGEHGEPVRGSGISLDVTERHTLEEQFHQSQKMEAIGRLAGGVAHDFNNLLTAILGYCELLLAGLAPDDPRQTDVLEIQKAGTSAAGLTRQLLAFSRKQIIQPTLIDLSEVVTGMRPMLGRLIGEDIEVVLGVGKVGNVKVDRGQVEQIVLNLAVNARDAMPNGGTLTIETANVELDQDYPNTHFAVEPGSYVALTVTDTGSGMTPLVQARMFEPFFTTKDVGKGTGLGLATVHGIVVRAGGSISVYSEVSRGTSFKVYFPRAGAAEVGDAPPAALARTTDAVQTVLVVEDAEALRALTKRLLERLGYAVLVAADAQEALLEFARNPSIDLLLTDVVMPGASGPDLTRQLLEQRPGLKVVYMSGYTEDAIVHHGVLDPGIAFLHKPFTSETLGLKLREALER